MRSKLLKKSKITPDQKEILDFSMLDIIEEYTIGVYDLVLLYDNTLGIHQVAIQRHGRSFTDIGDQLESIPNLPEASLSQFKAILQGWVHKYKKLLIKSHNDKKTRQYARILKAMGFHGEIKETILGDMVILHE